MRPARDADQVSRSLVALEKLSQELLLLLPVVSLARMCETKQRVNRSENKMTDHEPNDFSYGRARCKPRRGTHSGDCAAADLHACKQDHAHEHSKGHAHSILNGNNIYGEPAAEIDGRSTAILCEDCSGAKPSNGSGQG